MNRLGEEKSAYLRHASSQKIEWYPWCEEAFARAGRENKPVFLSSGAIWCHWCHVMAKESFEDDEIANILNTHFIAIKLDRDERPDIDRRYQRALGGMGFSGGWPLSIFLTPDKKPFYGGTYFPPREIYGRPSFKSILLTIAELYRTKREEILAHSEQLITMLNQATAIAGHEAPADKSLITKGVSIILSGADNQHGGFGTAPKFAMPGAMEFLLGRYFLSRDESIGNFLKKTLTSMAIGGIHDHLAGGFHRYSTDAMWIVPHFEKMADDNAWLLRNYSDAFSVFGDEDYRKIAEGIVDFAMQELSSADGGFYASQDADVTPDDEGGYFTWTDPQFKEALNEAEYKILSLFYLHDRGSMHHDSAKRVLHAPFSIDTVAKKAGVDPLNAQHLLDNGKAKLLAARGLRQKPFIDTAMYTSLNGMFISAFLRAYRALGDENILSFALKSLEKVLEKHYSSGKLLHSEGVEGLLDDYMFFTDALISGYETTGQDRYASIAETLMQESLNRFWDNESGGFFDTEETILGMRLKGIDDSPHPSANSMAILDLLKLSYLSGNDTYRMHAEKALGIFAPYAESMGVHAGYYYCGLDAFYNMADLSIEAAPQSDLSREVLSVFYPYTSIRYGDEHDRVIPCVRNICHEPLSDINRLKTILGQTNDTFK